MTNNTIIVHVLMKCIIRFFSLTPEGIAVLLFFTLFLLRLIFLLFCALINLNVLFHQFDFDIKITHAHFCPSVFPSESVFYNVDDEVFDIQLWGWCQYLSVDEMNFSQQTYQFCLCSLMCLVLTRLSSDTISYQTAEKHKLSLSINKTLLWCFKTWTSEADI